jgi:hypothetical protein
MGDRLVLSGNSTVNPVSDLDICYLQPYADVINVKSELIQLSFEFSDNTGKSKPATIWSSQALGISGWN